MLIHSIQIRNREAVQQIIPRNCVEQNGLYEEIEQHIKMKTSRLINIFLVVFVDMLGFGLILPRLLYYAETFSATPILISLIVASYATALLIGTPLMGRSSDLFGRRSISLLSVTGTFIGYVLLGFTHPIDTFFAHLFASQAVNAFIIAVLFASRILDGFTGGNITVAQAYLSYVTDEKNRSRGCGQRALIILRRKKRSIPRSQRTYTRLQVESTFAQPIPASSFTMINVPGVRV